MYLNGIGPSISAVMTREVYYRQFDNRRQVAGFLGLAPSPYDSGEVERSQGISRGGRGQVRGTMIQAAWLWIKHQPKSTLTRWFLQRTSSCRRPRNLNRNCREQMQQSGVTIRG